MITKLLDFIMNNTTYANREQLRRIVQKHLEYRTCMVIMEGNEPVAYARWNYENDKTVHVIDLIVRKDKRNGRILLELARKSLACDHHVETLVFKRGYTVGFHAGEWHQVKVKNLLRKMNLAVKIFQSNNMSKIGG